MKRLVKVLLTLFGVLCGILIAAGLLLHFVDLNPFRDRIAGLATKAIGRDIKIKGNLAIDLFPYPQVSLDDITLANAPWGSEPTMLSIGHVEAAVSYLSLFSDPIILRRVRLNDATVLLERNSQQIGNWVLGKDKPASTPAPKAAVRKDEERVHLPVMVDVVDFSNLTLTLRGAQGADQIYHLSSFSLKPEESGKMILTASGEVLKNPVRLDCTITSRASVAAHDAVNVGIEATLGDADVVGQVSTSRLATLADLQGTFNLTLEDVQKVLKKANLELPLNGPLTADAAIRIEGPVYRATVDAKVDGITTTVDGSYTDGQLDFSSTLTPLARLGDLFDLKGLSDDPLKLKAKVRQADADTFDIDQLQADVGPTRLLVRGRVDRGGEAKASLSLTSPDLSKLLGTLPAIDFTAKAATHLASEKIAVSDLAVTFAKSDISGDLTLVKGDKPAVTVKLVSQLLDLRPFGKASTSDEKAKAAPAPGATGATPEKKSAEKSRYVFKETPLQLEPLTRMEADAKITVNHFFYDIAELKDVVIDAAVHDGRVDGKFKCASTEKGRLAGRLDLKTQGKQASVETRLSISDAHLNLLKPDGLRLSEVPPTSVSVELTTRGASPREMAAVANGRVLLTQGSGKLANTLLKNVSGDIFAQLVGALNPFAEKETYSNWDCTVVSVHIVDGLADIDGLLAQGQKVMIVGGGDIDLKTEKLHLEFNTKPREGVGISADMFVTPFVKLTGTLASPGIGLNKKGAVLSTGAALATGGLSVLVRGLYDRTTAEGDLCEKSLDAAGSHLRYDF